MQTIIKRTAVTLAAMAMIAAGGTASADRGHHNHGGRVHFGLTLGAPLWYPGPYYSYPYPYPYTYPAPVVVQPAPRVYVERDDVAGLPSAPSTSPYWYYCRDSNTYYPYVRECASPWERVPAAPAAR